MPGTKTNKQLQEELTKANEGQQNKKEEVQYLKDHANATKKTAKKRAQAAKADAKVIKDLERQMKENEKKATQALDNIEQLQEQILGKMIMQGVINGINGNENAKLTTENKVFEEQLEIIRSTIGKEKAIEIQKSFEEMQTEVQKEIGAHVKTAKDHLLSTNGDLKKIQSMCDKAAKNSGMDKNIFKLDVANGDIKWTVNQEYIKKNFTKNSESIIKSAENKIGELYGNPEFKRATENFQKTLEGVTEKISQEPKVQNLWEKIKIFFKEMISNIRTSTPDLVEAHAMKTTKAIKGKHTEKFLNIKRNISQTQGMS